MKTMVTNRSNEHTCHPSDVNSTTNPEEDTGEWPVYKPVISTQESTQKLINTCLQLGITLVTFDQSELGKNGEISPDCMKTKMNAVFQSNCTHIIIDFSGTKSFGETSEDDAAGFLLKAISKAFQSNKKIIVCNANDAVGQRLHAFRVEKLYSSATSVDGAIASVQSIFQQSIPSDRP